MQIAHQRTQRHMVADGLDRQRRLIGRGHVIEHLQHAGDDEYQHQENRCTTGTERIAPAGLGRRDSGRVQVMEEVGAHDEKITPIRSLAQRGTPGQKVERPGD